MTATFIYTNPALGNIYRCPCGTHLREARLTEPCIGCKRVHAEPAVTHSTCRNCRKPIQTPAGWYRWEDGDGFQMCGNSETAGSHVPDNR